MRQILILSLALLLPIVASGKDEPCVDGVDCLCDRISRLGDPLYRSDVIWCEDFEHPNLRQHADQVPGRKEWTNLYGVGVGACIENPNPGSGTAFVRHGQDSNDCMDIVDEVTPTFTDGGCGVTGDNDCVFQGRYSLGHRMRRNAAGGVVGEARWANTVRDFGVTVAVKWSQNYLGPGDPGCLSTPEGTCGPAHKWNEFGTSMVPLMGAAVDSLVGRNIPFGGSIFTDGNPVATQIIGRVGVQNGRTRFGPDERVYRWRDNVEPGHWICLSMHYKGWGTSNTRFRYWYNDQKMIEGVTDTRVMWQGKDVNGIGSMFFNNFYNGADGTGSGYTGNTTAYRYEDNFIVTTGPEPIACAAIGLEMGDAAPPANTVPVPPVLLP